MDKMREEFERWYATIHQYGNSHKDELHKCWQVSRESMAVEFPAEMTPEYEGDGYKSRYDAAYCEGYNKALSDVENAIESAGIKVVSK